MAKLSDVGTELALMTVQIGSTPPDALDAANQAGNGSKAETDLPKAYLTYLDEMQKAWGDLPDLTITYQDFGYNIDVPVERKDIPNLFTAFRDGILHMNPFRDTKGETVTFKPLQSASGVVRPGELTLVLAPPGHGKSMLLKGLAGRLQRESENLRGEIRWNGLDAKQSAEAGQQVSKLCAFVDQGDVHYPMLTVRETFQFALTNSNADTTLLGSPEFTAMQEKKVDLMLELLGLKECADTVVGNNMLRGVSGGQKKRVTLGEMMITQARALFLDEISTGLDAAATFDITSALKKWTRVMRGSAYVALLQPAPEVFEMFDNIILMREGCIVFSGTVAQLKQHFVDIRITPNQDMDFADWITEFLTDPLGVWKRDIELLGHKSSVASFRKSFREEHARDAHAARVDVHAETLSVPAADAVDHSSDSREVIFHVGEDAPDQSGVHFAPTSAVVATRSKGLGQVITSTGIPLTTSQLKKAYESSRTFQNMQTEMRDAAYTLEKKYLSDADRVEPSPFTKAQYYQETSWGVWHHTKACLWRQYLFMTRSPEFIIPRIGQAIVMGLIIGSVFYQLKPDLSTVASRMGLIVFSLMFVAFGNLGEIPLASQFKMVIYKQVDAGFYSTFSYVFSVILMHFPLAIVECFIFGSCLYWMSGFANEAGRYFFFLLLLLGNDLFVSALFRTVAYTASNPDVANNLAGPITANLTLFGGFLITYDKIPNWLVEFFWLSPFAWALRSGAINEFKSDRYDAGVGDSYLEVWQINTRDAYKWSGIGYQWGVFLMFIILSAAALKYKRSWLTTGTRRTDIDEEDTAVEVRIGAKTTSMAAAAEEHRLAEAGNQLTFTKMDLSFVDLKYTVPVFEKNDATGEYEHKQRQLLTGINGYARAGELTALMGSSGAGKTTLMDVIAGRKTAGTIEGQILIDGHPQTFPSFNRLMGYCEQVDVHVGTDTVREAIAFSARLRLPSDITPEVRERFVDQILEDLELTPIANRLIGDANIPGLSPGQLKRVTIGVELAANPAFLFLDEPTSGLDSRAALIVCRVIRKISRRGRAVVCTIHQPSAELFYMFDRLLLLKSGGKEVYFGPVGEDGVNVVEYFMNADIGDEFYRPSLPDKVNPASWMLDVIGAGTSAKGKIAEYNSVYVASALREENMAVVHRLSTPKSDRPAVHFDSPFATTYATQLKEVLTRHFSVYWRDTSYNSTKFVLMMIIAFLFGFIYLNIGDDDEAGLTSKLSVIFTGLGFFGILQCLNVLPITFRLREVFYRERASNLYAPWVYTTSQIVVELPYLFICTCIFVIPYYFMIAFESDADLFFKLLLVFYLDAIFFALAGLFFSAALPNIQVAQIFQGVMFTFFFLFGGIFIQKSKIPTGWQFMYYLDPVPKGLVPIAIWQYRKYDCDPDTDATCPTLYSSTLGRQVTKWEFVINFVASGTGWEKNYLGWMVLSIFVVGLFVFIAVQKISHVKR